MVSTMFRTIQERDPGVPGYSGGFGDDGEKGMLGGGAMVRTAGGSGGAWREGEDDFVTESKIESAAAACILWSTVGVGCLLGGRPKASVSELLDYCRGGRRSRLVVAICWGANIVVSRFQTGGGRRDW